VLGAGLPKGSIPLPAFPNGSEELPSFPNGSDELPDFPNGSDEPPAFIQIRLTKAQASESAPVMLSPDGPAPRDRCPGVAAASGPATRRRVRRRESARRRRERVMLFSCPGGCAGRHHGCRNSASFLDGVPKDRQLVPRTVQSAGSRGKRREEDADRRAFFFSRHHLYESQSSSFRIC